MRLFFSYAHVDKLGVVNLVDVLRAGGFDPFWDDQLEPGEDWKAKLKAQIADCDAFLCILSKDSIESEWCQWELACAAESSKPIIPILLRAETPLPAIIDHLHYLDISEGLQNRDVAKLVGKLARMKQREVQVTIPTEETPVGLPSRFRQPLPRNYRTIAQGYLQPLTSDIQLYDWPEASPNNRIQTTSLIVGIDFGTTLSSVAVYHRNKQVVLSNYVGDLHTPSAVAIGSDGNPLTGRRAVDFLLKHPERGVLEVKRLFGNDIIRDFGGPPVLVVDDVAYSPVHLAALILVKLRQDAELRLQMRIQYAVLSAPAYFDTSQFAALRQAADLAGFKVLRVISEPVAACMGVGWVQDPEEKRVLIYDLGGGTFDASVLEIGEGIAEVKAVNGDTRIGGADFDKVIVDYCVQVFKERTGLDLIEDAVALMRLREAVERVKVTLSSARVATVHVPFIAVSDSTTLDLNVELTRTRYNELTHPFVSKTVQLSQEAIADAKYTLKDIDKVLVVGGAARAPSVSLALRDLYGNRVRSAPDHVVALGDALQGGVLSGEVKNVLLLDMLTRTLRVQVAHGAATPLLLRNQTIPTKRIIKITANGDNQRALLVRILAGESSFAERNLHVAEIQIPCDPVKAGATSVELTLDIDANMNLIVEAALENSSIAANTTANLYNPALSASEQMWTPPDKKFMMPVPDLSVQLPPLSQPERADLAKVERWLCKAATDLILRLMRQLPRDKDWKRLNDKWKKLEAWHRKDSDKNVPLELTSSEIWRHEGGFNFDMEREVLIDAAEQFLGADFISVRRYESIRSMAGELHKSLNK